MTKKFIKFLVPAVSALPYLALAQVVVPPPPVTSINNLIGTGGLVCKAFGYLFALLIILAVIFVLVAAFKYLTASGDTAKVTSANHQLIYAAVAIVVALIARGAPAIVGTFVGTTGGFGGC